jgi:tripartite ATP-independent transporter DctM subunit
MSIGLISIIIIGTMFLLLAMGLEVFISIGFVSAIGLIFFMDQSLDQFTYTCWFATNSFSLTAVPLFCFMGSLFGSSGVLARLCRGTDKILSFLPGGMAASSLGASGIFGAISGSSIASVAAFGTSLLPEMVQLGYRPRLAIGAIVMGGTLSVLIPPSVILIVYGGYQSISVPRLFAGGLIPGVILGFLYLVTIIILVKLNPDQLPQAARYTWRDRLDGLVDILPATGIILFVLGTIFGGVMTPTEAASLGAFLSMVLSLVYRQLNWTTFMQATLGSVKVTCMMIPLLAMVKVFGYVFQYLGAADALAEFVLASPLGGKYGILTIIFLIYIVLGTFMEGISIMLLSLCFVGPIISEMGFSLVWFGVIVVVVNELGLVTPPFGLNLFSLNSVAPQYSVFTIARAAVPYYPAVLILLVLCVVFPELITWLPHVLF